MLAHSGVFWYSRGAQKGPFGIKQALTGRKAPGAKFWARPGPNCRQLVQLGWSHSYHTPWPGIGPLLGPQKPQKGPILAKNDPFGSPGGTWRAPGGQSLSQLPPIGLTGLESWLPHNLAFYWASLWTPGDQKGPVLARNAPFWGS